MRNTILIVFAGLMVLCAGRPKPEEHARWNRYPHALARLLTRNLDPQRRQTDTYNCRDLSAAAGDLLNALADPELGLLPKPLYTRNPYVITDIMEMYLGFDPVNDREARDMFYCSLTPATSVADLKERLDAYDYNYNMARAAYDALVVQFGVMQANGIPPSGSLFYSLGAFSLDLEGAQELRDILGIPAGELPDVMPTQDNLIDKCVMLQSLAHQAFQSIPPQDTYVSGLFYNITGIHIHDRKRIDHLICDLVGAAPGGLRSIYQMLEGRGIILHAYEHALYPVLQKYATISIDSIEMLLMLEEMNSANSIQEYPNYGGQYSSYDGQYPGHGGPGVNGPASPPGGPGGPPGGPGGPPGGPVMAQQQAQKHLMRLMLAYLKEVKASGLLSLQ